MELSKFYKKESNNEKIFTYLNLIVFIILFIMVNIAVWTEKIDYAILYSIWFLTEFILLILLILLTNKK